jgi:hypothetical protein
MTMQSRGGLGVVVNRRLLKAACEPDTWVSGSLREP